MQPYIIDLAQGMPRELIEKIGELTVMFGRLEHLVLLVIKRLRNEPLEKIQQLYESYSLGAKVSGGRKVCEGAEGLCGNQNSQQGLRELANGNNELLELCIEIEKLTAERNRVMHGLFTTVADQALLMHKKKLYLKTKEEFWELQERIANVIVSLNELVPAPGIHASLASQPYLEVYYDDKALSGDEPVVRLLGHLNE